MEFKYFNLFVGISLAALLILGVAGLEKSETDYPSAEDIAKLVVVPSVEFEDLSNEKLDAVHNKVFEDDAWEELAESLATAEWTERDYKDLYRAIDDIYGDIDDEDDIIYVKEDESTDFKGMDADDQDGYVIQYLKVKYEDKDGDDVKRYITVVTEFDEGDLEEQDFSKTK